MISERRNISNLLQFYNFCNFPVKCNQWKINCTSDFSAVVSCSDSNSAKYDLKWLISVKARNSILHQILFPSWLILLLLSAQNCCSMKHLCLLKSFHSSRQIFLPCFINDFTTTYYDKWVAKQECLVYQVKSILTRVAQPWALTHLRMMNIFRNDGV